MWMTRARIFYAGLLGSPSVRRLGAWTLYFTCDAPLRLALANGEGVAGPWQEGLLAVVPPYRAHRVASAGRRLPDVLIEPESIDLHRLADPLGPLLRAGGAVFDATHPMADGLLHRLRAAHDRVAASPGPLGESDADFDALVFGAPLPLRPMDPRIARALARLEQPEGATLSAQCLADEQNLSFSRFVHLFSAEVGVPLRTFRSWKRARHWLRYVTRDAKLTEMALHTGYPDSAHFSRSIRQVFGLQPKEVLAGSKHLALHGDANAEPRPARRTR
jgi:AraC-like DNA-binding protein